jgi:hypothetical protein
MDLDRLNRDEYLQALRLIMQEFWSKAKLSPDQIYYPFSKDFFLYLFDFRLHKFRDILNDLNTLWGKMQLKQKVQQFGDSFEILRYIRSQSEQFSHIEAFKADSLLPYEKNALNKKWNSINSSFADKDRSKLEEKELCAFIDVLKEHEIPRQIGLVQENSSL